MKFDNYITESEKKRTIKVLHEIRKKYGIDAYFLFKKMFTIVMIIKGRAGWLKYEYFLERNERYMRTNYPLDNILMGNCASKDSSSFFGINGKVLHESTLTEIERMMIDKYLQY